jgi:hypothetical protein
MKIKLEFAVEVDTNCAKDREAVRKLSEILMEWDQERRASEQEDGDE